MISNLNKNKLYVIESDYKVEAKATFYSLLYESLTNNEKVLLIKYNHSNTYGHFIDNAKAENVGEDIIDNFHLIQVEIYASFLSDTFDTIKRFGEKVDRIFIEKPNVEDEYKYLDYLREMKRSVFVLPAKKDKEYAKHCDYLINIGKEKQNVSTKDFILSCTNGKDYEKYKVVFVNYNLLKQVK